jgi:hypothetical protein
VITNAMLHSIIAPPAVTNDGGETHGPPVSIGVRCFVDAPRRAQLLAKANVVADATAVMYVEGLAQESRLVERARVSFTIDGSVLRELQVIHATPFIKAGGISHVEAFLKAI